MKAFISGGSQGIGKACVQYFLNQKYDVYNLSRQKCSVKEVHNLLIDLSDLKNLEKNLSDLTQAILSQQEKIVLILSASKLIKDTIHNFDITNFQSVVNLNILSQVILVKYFLNFLKPGSSIIFIGSTLSEKGVKNSLSYITTKHAQLGIMRSVAQDLEGKEIHTCLVCPGFTDTLMLQKHLGHQEVIEQVKKSILFKRLIHPEEIAKFIYECSQNPIINGSCLHVNLGQL